MRFLKQFQNLTATLVWRSAVLCAALLSPMNVRGQTLYVPSGMSGIGTSTSGNVGIGTSSPGAKFEVSGDGVFSKDASYQLTMHNSSGSSARTSGLNLKIDNVNLWQLITDNAAGNKLFVQHNGLASHRFLSIDTSGNVGISGTLALNGGAGALSVNSQQLNPGWATGAYIVNNVAISANGTYYPIATTGYARQIISAGIRSDGYLMGFDGGGWRADSADAGSLASIIGMRLQYGHYYTLNSGAHTDTVIGLSVEPYFQAGSIGNVYGVMIGGASGATVTGNIFGVYQYDANAKNFFSGNVGIGTTNPTQKLSVNGTIRAKEVIVEASPWPDDVFEDGYKLKALSEVAAHIEEHGHLPDVPNAATVAEQGVTLGEMQSTLLRKVEELTLYILQQDERARQQDRRIAELEQRLQDQTSTHLSPDSNP